MRTKSLVILAAMTAGVVAGAAVTLTGGPRAPVEPTAGGPLFPGLLARVNDVARIDVTTAKGAVVIRRDDAGAWVLPDKGGYAADPSEVKSTVVGLAEADIVDARTAIPDLYDRIGVQDPAAVGSASTGVVLKGADGQDLAAVIVGKRAAAGSGASESTWYVRRVGEAPSWLVRAPLDGVEADPMRWIDRSVPRLPRERVMSVEIRQPDGATVTLSRESPATRDFHAAGLPDGARTRRATVEETVGALGYVTFEDVVKADPAWFADGPVATFRSFDGIVVTVRTALRDGARWLSFDAAFVPEQAKAATGDATDAAGVNGSPKAGDAETQAREWAARHAGWAYRVYDALAEDFGRGPAAFIDEGS